MEWYWNTKIEMDKIDKIPIRNTIFNNALEVLSEIKAIEEKINMIVVRLNQLINER